MYRRRPHSSAEGIIALLFMLLINLIALPILGIAGIISDSPNQKAQGIMYLIIGGIIWGIILIAMASK